MKVELDWLKPVLVKQVGSTVTCDPPVQGTDVDFLVLTEHPSPSLLAAKGYELDKGSDHYEPSQGKFNSWRKGRINLIVTYDEQFYNEFLRATLVAKSLNLLDKRDRIKLFQALLYGNYEYES